MKALVHPYTAVAGLRVPDMAGRTAGRRLVLPQVEAADFDLAAYRSW